MIEQRAVAEAFPPKAEVRPREALQKESMLPQQKGELDVKIAIRLRKIWRLELKVGAQDATEQKAHRPLGPESPRFSLPHSRGSMGVRVLLPQQLIESGPTLVANC